MVYNFVVEMKHFPCDMFSLYKVICEREIELPYISETTAVIISACVTAAVVIIIGLILYYDVLHFIDSCKQSL